MVNKNWFIDVIHKPKSNFLKTLFEQLLKKSIIFAKTNLFGKFPLRLFLKGLGGFDSWNKKYCLFKASQTYCKTNFDQIITKCVSWFFYIGFIVMDAVRICLIFFVCDGSYYLWNKIRKNKVNSYGTDPTPFVQYHFPGSGGLKVKKKH